MIMLFCVITLVSHEEELSIKDSNCDAKHTTLIQILLKSFTFQGYTNKPKPFFYDTAQTWDNLGNFIAMRKKGYLAGQKDWGNRHVIGSCCSRNISMHGHMNLYLPLAAAPQPWVVHPPSAQSWWDPDCPLQHKEPAPVSPLDGKKQSLTPGNCPLSTVLS